MARGRPSRRSRSDCPRLGAPGSSCRRREARRRPSKLAERLNPIPRPPQSRISLRESGRERCSRPSNGSSGIPHRRARSRDRRIRRQRTELGKIARLRQRRPLGLASATNSYFHILGDKLNGDARDNRRYRDPPRRAGSNSSSIKRPVCTKWTVSCQRVKGFRSTSVSYRELRLPTAIPSTFC